MVSYVHKEITFFLQLSRNVENWLTTFCNVDDALFFATVLYVSVMFEKNVGTS